MAPDDDSMIGQDLVDFRNEERFAGSGREPRHRVPPPVSASRVLTDSSEASRPVQTPYEVDFENWQRRPLARPLRPTVYRPGFRLRTRVAVLFVAACFVAVAYLLLRVNGQT